MKKILLTFQMIAQVGSILSYCVGQSLTCLSNVTLDIGHNCSASITPDMIGVSLNHDPAYTYALSRSEFDCSDVGHSYDVVLQLRDAHTGVLLNSCVSHVSVICSAVPSPCEHMNLYAHSEITVTLNDEGFVVLTPEMIGIGPLSTNPYFVYGVTPNVLDCDDVGANTVRLNLYSACYPTNYVTMTVNVVDRGGYGPTCHHISTGGINFFPAHLDQELVFPGSEISYFALLNYQGELPNLPAEFRMFLSRDNAPDSKDLLIDKKQLIFKKSPNGIAVSGKFILPRNLLAGNYYLIADLYSKNKKASIGFKTIVQAIHVGKSNKSGDIVSRERADLNDQNEDISIYPNPFNSMISIRFPTSSEGLHSVEFINSVGTIIKKIEHPSGTIDTEDLGSGIYLIRVTDNLNHTMVKKMIKQ